MFGEYVLEAILLLKSICDGTCVMVVVFLHFFSVFKYVKLNKFAALCMYFDCSNSSVVYGSLFVLYVPGISIDQLTCNLRIIDQVITSLSPFFFFFF